MKISVAITVVKGIIGVCCLCSLVYESPNIIPFSLRGIKSQKNECQQFVNELVNKIGFSKPVPIRETTKEIKAGWPTAQCIGSTLFGRAQILLPEKCPFTNNELKFICAHEIGHLMDHDVWIVASIVISFIALTVLIPHSWVTLALLETFQIGVLFTCYHWLEKRADKFALEHCPLEIQEAALTALDKRAKFETEYTKLGWKHQIDFWMLKMLHPSVEQRRAMVREFIDHN